MNKFLVTMPTDQSKMFDDCIFVIKLFGISIERSPSIFIKIYSYTYVLINFVIYNILLTLNLYYTPRKIELLISEVIFYFTEVSTCSKVIILIFMREKVVDILEFVNRDEFKGDYGDKNGLLYKYTNRIYKLWRKAYVVFSNISFVFMMFTPIRNYINRADTDLPVCKYYFLSDQAREKYYTFWFIYQPFGLYGHMMYNVNFDLMTGGLFIFIIVQLQLLYNNLSNLKVSEEESLLPEELQDKIQVAKLHQCLRHYALIIE